MIKKRIFALLLSVTLFVTAFSGSLGAVFAAENTGKTYYFDAENGNDNFDGLSEAKAFAHLSVLENLNLNPGDTVLLKRGQVFDVADGKILSSGTKEKPIVISAYSTGERPIIRSKDRLHVFTFCNVNYITMSELQFTAPTGYGMVIVAVNAPNAVSGITIDDCNFYDIATDLEDDNTGTAAIVITAVGCDATVSDVTFRRLTIDNGKWGIHIDGIDRDHKENDFVSYEASCNRDILIEDCVVQNQTCGGIVVGSVYRGTVRNCRVLDCATSQSSAYAPLWIRHSSEITVEYCEIAGSTNTIDGMAIDFDGWTVNSTYDHIYSHDNVRFVRSCVYDSETKNRGNTVTNCVSVNDNSAVNWSSIALINFKNPSLSLMHDYRFENNTVVNGKPFLWIITPCARVSGNTFVGNILTLLCQMLFNVCGFHVKDTYRCSDADLQAKIEEITCRLPAIPQ